VFSGGWIVPNTALAGIVNWHCGRWEEAETNFEAAIHQVDTLAQYLRGHVREWFAKMLVARGRAGDEARARQLTDDAREFYLKFGYLGLARRLG
jgi:hypothetical protein